MYFLLALIITGVIGYFVPNWVCELTWTELFEAHNGAYDEDFIKALDIVNKVGLKDDYTAFFREQIIICIAITIGVFIAMIIVTTLIKRLMTK